MRPINPFLCLVALFAFAVPVCSAAAVHGPAAAPTDKNIALLDKLMSAYAKRLQSAKTARATIQLTMQGEYDGKPQIGIVESKKPNLIRVELWPASLGRMAPNVPHYIQVDDGSTLWTVGRDKLLAHAPAAKNGEDIDAASSVWSDFYLSDNSSFSTLMKGCAVAFHDQSWQGATYEVATVTGSPLHGARIELYFDRNGFVDRLRVTEGPAKSLVMDLGLTHVRVNEPIPQSHFTFNRPVFAVVPKPKVDPAARAILETVQTTYQNLNSLSGHAVGVTHGYIVKQKRALYNGYDDDITVMKPDYFRLDSSWVSFRRRRTSRHASATCSKYPTERTSGPNGISNITITKRTFTEAARMGSSTTARATS